MAKIKTIKANELVGGGTSEQRIYPVTAFQSVYDSTNSERLDFSIRRNGIINVSGIINSASGVTSHTLESAIKAVEERYRALGASIKFYDGESWNIYQFSGTSLASWEDTELWSIPWSIDTTTISNWKKQLPKVLTEEIAIESTKNYVNLTCRMADLSLDATPIVAKILNFPQVTINNAGFLSASQYEDIADELKTNKEGLDELADEMDDLSKWKDSLPTVYTNNASFGSTMDSVTLTMATFDLQDPYNTDLEELQIPNASTASAGIITSLDYQNIINTAGYVTDFEDWRNKLPELLTGQVTFDADADAVRFNKSTLLANAPIENSDPQIINQSYQFPMASKTKAGAITSDDYTKLSYTFYKEAEGELVPKGFVDQWNSNAGDYGKFNEETGYFELNGITDIPYSEALVIMSLYNGQYNSSQINRAFSPGYNTNLKKVRTLFLVSLFAANADSTFYSDVACYKALRVYFNNVTTIAGAFNVPGLEYVYGEIKLNNSVTSSQVANAIGKDVKYIRISNLKVSANFRYAVALDYDSMEYLITEATNTSAISITVSAAVYAKLTGDTTNSAAAALSTEEAAKWKALVTTAANKNITFVTA
jgi:hypothetical protein